MLLRWGADILAAALATALERHPVAWGATLLLADGATATDYANILLLRWGADILATALGRRPLSCYGARAPPSKIRRPDNDHLSLVYLPKRARRQSPAYSFQFFAIAFGRVALAPTSFPP